MINEISSRKRFQSDSSISDDDLSTDQRSTHPISSPSTLIKPFAEEFLRERRKKVRLEIEKAEKFSFILRSSLTRSDLFHQGYAVLSDQSFPFYSICYLCGSTGDDLIDCNQCAQVYHRSCLNENERPRFHPVPENWSCPNCQTCRICGLTCKTSSISCFDCQRHYHRHCLKSNENDLSNVVIQRWLCPLCIKCDCGQRIRSTDENLFPIGKSISSQQTLMCVDCFNNLKDLRTKSNIKLEKCHLCQRYLSQYLTKSKPLFSLSLISQQLKQKQVPLFQCRICEHHFHPECDAFLPEDVFLHKTFSIDIICSICNRNEKSEIQRKLFEKKLEILQNILRDVTSLVIIVLSDEDRFQLFQRSVENLQILHQSVGFNFNLQTFLNELFLFIDSFLSTSQWRNAIENCFHQHFPPFLCRSSREIVSIRSPSIDHCYASIEKKFVEENSSSSWTNFHRNDTRQCSICSKFAENSSRFVPIGLNRWTHLHCLLPLYAKTFQSTILNDIQQTIELCQTKFHCDFCSKFGATISCFVKNCSTRFHRICLEEFYRQCSSSHWQISDGLLPNLTTLCPKHVDAHRNESFLPISSSIQIDLSNTNVEFAFDQLQLAIGSLQIEHLGHFDYLINEDFQYVFDEIYPDDYRASRVFWSTKNVREKTIYHLKIRLEQNYHLEKKNHRTFSNPPTDDDQRENLFYEKCRNYFEKFNVIHSATSSDRIAEILSIDTKTLRNLFTTKSKEFSPFVFALFQALQQIDRSMMPQLDGTIDESASISTEDLVRFVCQWKRSKMGQVKFFIHSDDGFAIESDDLDAAWSNVLEQIRSCRNDMKLTHLTMNNDEVNGHQIFGLTKTLVKQLFQRIFSQRFATNDEQLNQNFLFLSSPNSSRQWFKKKTRRNFKEFSSRSSIYRRKSSQRRCFNWLTNPHRTLENALETFEIDEPLRFVREILLQQASVALRLSYLSFFADRVLFVGTSSIHGCGLFTLIDLVDGQMIIEYTGEIIRHSLTDQRERDNERKNVGCYMFTVDSMNVIDATYQGNKARFINHHCQPNCYAKTVDCAGKKHIVIYAGTDIPRGSELTYDYSFQEEDIKIPCHCGTSQCRMYLN